jgi:two-component system cell cycle response regulator
VIVMIHENIDDIDCIRTAAQQVLKNDLQQLPLVPTIASKLLNLTSNDHTKLEDLSKLIETEPVLSAKILQNVNSAAYALPNPISSIRRAVNLLGFSTIRRTALTLIFFNRLIKKNVNQAFDPLFFWQHCLFVASLSRRMAVAIGHPDPDMVYTAGLLHGIGKVVLESHGLRSYSEFINSLNGDSEPTLTEERHFFGLTHTEIGHLLCVEWQLPLSITAVVAYYQHPTAAVPPYDEFDLEITLVSFANYIAWMQGLASHSAESRPDLPQKVLEILDIDRFDLESLLQQVDEEMLSIREFFGIQFPDLNKLRANLIQTSIALSQNAPAQAQTGALNAGFAAEIPASLTAPHQSLNPDDFVPMTLAAIQRDFGFDQVQMLTVDPVHRSLVSSYRHSLPPIPENSPSTGIPIDTKAGLLIDCMRTKKPIIINTRNDPDNPALKLLNVNEFLAVPILQHRRLIGVILADNSRSKNPMRQSLTTEIVPIAHQLGIALLNAKHYEAEKKHAQLDPLTQILNKRMLDQSLAEIFQHEKSKLEKMAIGFVDIDKFKLFNDTCGHQAGDKVIQIVADLLSRLTRPGDVIGRYGGEEFLFILLDTSKAGAHSYAERIRMETERLGRIMSPKFNDLSLTVSIGISFYHPDFSTYSEMIEIADQAMYRAKHEGRNRVIMLSDITGEPKSPLAKP